MNDTATTGAVTTSEGTSAKAPKRVSAANHAKRASASKREKPAGKSQKKSTQKRQPESQPTGRAGTKSAKILGLIRRPAGASLAAIMKATGWQAHSVRGFLSTAPQRYQIHIESAQNETGERVYRATR